MKPRLGLLDKRFVWVPSHATDIRATLDRERERLKVQRENVSRETARVLDIFNQRRIKAKP